MSVQPCELPAGSGLADFRDAAPHLHWEAVCAALPPGRPPDARDLARLAMEQPSLAPERASWLLDGWIAVQSALLRPFGVRPNSMRGGRPQELPRAGGSLGPYGVLVADPREVLLGDRDSFLEHRMSFLVDDGRAVLGVVQRSLGRGGDAYWSRVRDNQTEILRWTLSRGLDRLNSEVALRAAGE